MAEGTKTSWEIPLLNRLTSRAGTTPLKEQHMCVCVCLRVCATMSEEVLDEGSHQLHPQLDVAVGLLEGGAGHLGGALVQHLLLLQSKTPLCPIARLFVLAAGGIF